MPITDIEPADVLAAVRKIERKGHLGSARRTLQLAGAVRGQGAVVERSPRPAAEGAEVVPIKAGKR